LSIKAGSSAPSWRDASVADQAMSAVDADVVLVAEARDREINTGCTIVTGLGFGVFDRPACINDQDRARHWLCVH
jgi:hypothetical protein